MAGRDLCSFGPKMAVCILQLQSCVCCELRPNGLHLNCMSASVIMCKQKENTSGPIAVQQNGRGGLHQHTAFGLEQCSDASQTNDECCRGNAAIKHCHFRSEKHDSGPVSLSVGNAISHLCTVRGSDLARMNLSGLPKTVKGDITNPQST